MNLQEKSYIQAIVKEEVFNEIKYAFNVVAEPYFPNVYALDVIEKLETSIQLLKLYIKMDY